jgi:hypothetical protein
MSSRSGTASGKSSSLSLDSKYLGRKEGLLGKSRKEGRSDRTGQDKDRTGCQGQEVKDRKSRKNAGNGGVQNERREVYRMREGRCTE